MTDRRPIRPRAARSRKHGKVFRESLSPAGSEAIHQREIEEALAEAARQIEKQRALDSIQSEAAEGDSTKD